MIYLLLVWLNSGQVKEPARSAAFGKLPTPAACWWAAPAIPYLLLVVYPTRSSLAPETGDRVRGLGVAKSLPQIIRSYSLINFAIIIQYT